MSGGERQVVKEITVQAPPERLWHALTDPDELMRWFPPVARVEPGEGGTITLSWGAGMEGTAPIHLWEPNQRFGWVEQHPGEPPVRIAVEFELEAAAGGRTTVRLVQSGFGPDADWNEYITSVDGGWTYFLANLRHYLERHRDTPRTMVSERRPPGMARDQAWDRLLSDVFRVRPLAEGQPCTLELPGLRTLSGTAFIVRVPHHFACTLAELNDALLLVELEPGGEQRQCGVWLSLYGVDVATAIRARAALAAAVARAWQPADDGE